MSIKDPTPTAEQKPCPPLPVQIDSPDFRKLREAQKTVNGLNRPLEN